MTGVGMKSLLIIILIPLSLVLSQVVQPLNLEERQLANRFNLAQRLEREGQVQQALEIYKALVDARPANFAWYSAYVNLLFAQKDLLEAERIIVRFRKCDPKNEQAAVDQGKLIFLNGDTLRALRHWHETLTQQGHSINLYRTVFNTMSGCRLFDQARDLISEARRHHQKPDLFALELANFHLLRLNYAEAVREYLLFGRYNPKSYSLVTGQILRLPKDEMQLTLLDSLVKDEIENQPNNPDLHRLRADLLFKYSRYSVCAEEILIIENLTGNRGTHILNLGKDLINTCQFSEAEKVYTGILQRPELRNSAPLALLGLAEAIEKAVLSKQTISAMDYLYSGNLFFNTPFIQQLADSQQSLARAFQIYDSLIINLPRSNHSAQALFRLADLRFTVVRDFDGAEQLLRQALATSTDTRFKVRCQSRIGEVLLSRGDPRAALQLFENEARRWTGTEYEKDFRVYATLATYLSGELDSLANITVTLLPLLGVQHPAFNDAVELANFVTANYTEADATGQRAFREFVRSEAFIRQNKLSEALDVLTNLLQTSPQVPCAAPARFRLMQVYLQFRQWIDAEQLAEFFVTKPGEFSDQVVFMCAELADRRDLDLKRAEHWYEVLLEKFPNSLRVDAARKRLRELQAIKTRES